MKLLIIEDKEAIGQPLKRALEKRNFAVDYAVNGEEGYRKAFINNYDCILLDLNLPEKDGIEIAKQLRAENNSTSIIMLTARSLKNNMYEGFEAGADDYITKPFDFKELLYRINAVISHKQNTKENVITVGDIALDTYALSVHKAGERVQLNAKEYGILEYIMRNKNKVVSQEELLEHVWNEEIDSFTQTVRTNIKTLRRKVDPDKKYIKTFKGKGYVIEG